MMRSVLLMLILAALLAQLLVLGCSSRIGTASYYNRNTANNCAIIDDWRVYCPRDRDCAREEIPN